MNQTIVHISTAGLGDTLGEILAVKSCQRVGMKVIYLDISHWLGYSGQKHNAEFSEIIINVASEQEFLNFIASLDVRTTVINVQLTPDRQTNRCIKLIMSSNFFKTYFDVGNLPEPQWKFQLRKLKYVIKPFAIQPDVVFRSGERSVISFSKKVKILPINYSDYDFYLNCLTAGDRSDSTSDLGCSKYILFLDQYLPLHPDFVSLDGVGMDTKEYYLSILRYLRRIAESMNAKIVIAAHPKADLSFLQSEDVTVIKNNTFQLVQHAEVVFAHYSTAISYAILFEKPIVFLLNDSILKSRLSKILVKQIKNLAFFLKAPLHYCEKEFIFPKLQIDLDAYDRYKFNYLTTHKTKDNISNFFVVKYFQSIFQSLLDRH